MESFSAEITSEIKPSKALVAQGSSHFLAIANDGSLYEWGRDSYGEFSSSKPKKLAEPSFITLGVE